MTSALDAWRDAFDDHDRCPWPGPRPLREDDVGLLIGRAEDRQSFQRIVREHRLVLLHGLSGVGKTSLLRAGLIPDLKRSGHTVYYADQWGGVQLGDLADFLVERLELPGTGMSAFENVNRESVVLVLDQFEELIRYSPARAAEAFDLILKLNRTADTKIVISFRSEYLHEFADLEANVVNFSTAHMRLAEVHPDAAKNVVLAGIRRQADAVDEIAAELIADAWRDAQRATVAATNSSDPFHRIGLLHLQAFLYALHFTLGRGPITEADVREALATWGATEGTGITAPFREALQKAVDYKLEHCRSAAADLERDGTGPTEQILIEGTQWAVVRSVEHLSSAGYKLIRQARELAELALGRDYDALMEGIAAAHGPVTSEQVDALFQTLLALGGLGTHRRRDSDATHDLLTADRQSIAARADEVVGDVVGTRWQDRLTPSAGPIADKLGVTSGALMGQAPADVLIAELCRVVFGLVWLEQCALIRITTLPGAGAMVSLIHDGFGSALLHWSRPREQDPRGPLSAITAPRGASFGWRELPARPGERRRADVGGGSEHAIHANLVWRGGWIRADLERVVFVNCDFRGLLFDGCRLTGVNFVNCLLDGAIFSDCVLTDPLDVEEDDVWSPDEPTFVIDAPAALVAAHASYRGVPHTHDAFLSPLPGAPAVPYQGEPGRERLRRPDAPEQTGRLEALLARGGAAIHGGRVSSLVIRRCHVEDGSSWLLRHTTGSGLDLVELEAQPTRLKVYGSALRHISLSPVVGGAPGTIDVDVDGSVLSQVWVAPDLRGSVVARSSTLIHVWNGSPRTAANDGVEFTVADGCRYHGLIDVAVAPTAQALGPGEQTVAFDAIGDPALRLQQRQMDYRRNPARSAAESARDGLGGAPADA